MVRTHTQINSNNDGRRRLVRTTTTQETATATSME
jgi:hypothetical protein